MFIMNIYFSELELEREGKREARMSPHPSQSGPGRMNFANIQRLLQGQGGGGGGPAGDTPQPGKQLSLRAIPYLLKAEKKNST